MYYIFIYTLVSVIPVVEVLPPLLVELMSGGISFIYSLIYFVKFSFSIRGDL